MSKFYYAAKQREAVCTCKQRSRDPESSLSWGETWRICERFLDSHRNFHLYFVLVNFCNLQLEIHINHQDSVYNVVAIHL